MAITSERLKQTFSEGGAQEIYQEVKAEGGFLAFAQRYVFNEDDRVSRSALWGLTKANKKEISQLQVILNELIDLAMRTENSSVRRLTINIIERLEIKQDELRTDFLDFCLEHMTNLEELPGIQAICMKVAYRMCQLYPELNDEFQRIIESMEISYYKPAVVSARNNIIRKSIKRNT